MAKTTRTAYYAQQPAASSNSIMRTRRTRTKYYENVGFIDSNKPDNGKNN
jgi:hypothetical protein